MLVLPSEIGEGLQLGSMFQIVPFGYSFHKLSLTTTEGPMQVDILRLSDSGGCRGYAFLDRTLKAFAADAVKHSSGLHIPSSPGGNGNVASN